MTAKREDDPNELRQPIASDLPSGSLAEVRLLNDEQTTMEFVVHVLQEVFGKDREAAMRIMLAAHNEGSGVCGIYPYDIAEAKVTEVLGLAHRHGYPLRCALKRSASIA